MNYTLHEINHNNLIIGDFNFIENDIDKGKGMDQRDKTISKEWDKFKTEKNIIDPFRKQCPNKKVYSYIAPTGKSRGDRLYVNEDNINNITNVKYIKTHFNAAHKIMTFEINEQNRGPGIWKMNSSVLKDTTYKAEIEKIIQGINTLNITNPLDWWDLFIMVARSVTMDYSKRKAKVQQNLKKHVTTQIDHFESLTYTDMTEQQREQLSFYKNKHKEIQEKEIQGHQIRTRGLPRYEMKEPDIDFYAKLEKRSSKKKRHNTTSRPRRKNVHR